MPSDFNKEKGAYLEMIQSVINRMAANSFAIKNWFIVSFGGLLALFFAQGKIEILTVAIIIALFFASYDAYYLHLERNYRELYKLAVEDKVELFDMNARRYATFGRYLRVFCSPSMLLYLAAFVVICYIGIAYF